MDANYLKSTVGPILQLGLASLMAHGNGSHQIPNTTDGIQYLGNFLLHYDRTKQFLQQSKKQTEATRSLKLAVDRRFRLMDESRRKLDQELAQKMTQMLLELQRKEEEEIINQKAAAAKAAADEIAAKAAPPQTEGAAGAEGGAAGDAAASAAGAEAKEDEEGNEDEQKEDAED